MGSEQLAVHLMHVHLLSRADIDQRSLTVDIKLDLQPPAATDHFVAAIALTTHRNHFVFRFHLAAADQGLMSFT